MPSLFPLRVFTCHECGHKMRLSGDTCGRCSALKPEFQGVFYRLLILSPLAVVGVLGIVVVSLM